MSFLSQIRREVPDQGLEAAVVIGISAAADDGEMAHRTEDWVTELGIVKTKGAAGRARSTDDAS